MCFFSRQTKVTAELINRYNARIANELQMQLVNEYNGFTFPRTPVITDREKGVIDHLQWGLIPFWAKDDSIRKYTLNARIETLTEKPSFKSSVDNRCLVIADGFYEWQWLDPKEVRKQKYLITIPGEELFSFAGIWSSWTNRETGEIVRSYAIVTTEANPLMSEIHNSKKRMPVILTKENENDWINGQAILDFAHPQIDLVANVL